MSVQMQEARPESRHGEVLRVGVGGPVGSGKTALVDALCKRLRDRFDIAVVTNDIYTREDAEFLIRSQALPAERIRGVETGGCPHTAIREDASMNLAAIDALMRQFQHLDLVIVESGGDNLAATFSPELSDLTLYVIDVAAGDKIPRKGGPGIMKSDLLIINKIDLAPHVGASLEVMERDARKMRGERPFVFTNLKPGTGSTRWSNSFCARACSRQAREHRGRYCRSPGCRGRRPLAPFHSRRITSPQRIVRLDVGDLRIVQQPADGAGRFAAVYQRRVRHHVRAIERPQRQNPPLQHLRHLIDENTRGLGALAYEDGVSRPVRGVRGLVQVVQQQCRLPGLQVPQLDAVWKSGVRIDDIAACTADQEFVVGQIEQRTERFGAEAEDAKGHG